MKKITFLLLAISFSSYGSFYQQDCSNADGSVTSANGHVKNNIVLTEAYFGSDYRTAKVEYGVNDLDVKVVEEVEISNTSSCRGGMFSSKKITYKKVSYTNPDGSLFSDKTLGVSKDLKSVEANLICEMNMNGRGACSN